MTAPTKMKTPKGYKMGGYQKFTPEQMDLFKQMFSYLGPDSFLAQLASGNPEAFKQMERPALEQFSNVQAGIGNRFSGMGTGAQKSSGFINTQNQAAQQFASQLQAQRLGLQNQAIKDLISLSSNLLQQNPYEQFLVKKKPGFWESFGGEFAKSFGSGLGNLASGGYGGSQGQGGNNWMDMWQNYGPIIGGAI